MSHLITVKSQITDKDILKSALSELKLSFEEKGDIITLKGHVYYNNSLSVNTKTGEISGDNDRHRSMIGDIKQRYGVEEYLHDMRMKGHKIEKVETVGQKIQVFVAA